MKKVLFSHDYLTCSCGKVWPDEKQFLSDESVDLVGFQPAPDIEHYGRIVFNHSATGCGTSFMLNIRKFFEITETDLDCPDLVGTPNCPGTCMRLDDMAQCFLPCSRARIRVFMLELKRRQDVLRRRAASSMGR